MAGSGEEDWKGSHAARGSCCARPYSGGELRRPKPDGDGQNGRRCAVAGSGEEDWKGSHAARGSCCARPYSGGELRRPKPGLVQDRGECSAWKEGPG